jgi:hypothetical protein
LAAVLLLVPAGAVFRAYPALLDAFRAGRLLLLGGAYPAEGSVGVCGGRYRAKLEGGAVMAWLRWREWTRGVAWECATPRVVIRRIAAR